MFEDTEEAAEALPATREDVVGWMTDAPRVEVETQAGWWLRSLAEVEAQVAALDAREEGELERIRRHYARYRAPLAERRDALERCLDVVAEALTFTKGKSLALTYGTIGRRTVPARIAVIDAETALATIRTLLPSAVRIKESVDVKAATPAVMSAIGDGVDVPGFELVPTHEAPYAKTNGLALSQGVA